MYHVALFAALQTWARGLLINKLADIPRLLKVLEYIEADEDVGNIISEEQQILHGRIHKAVGNLEQAESLLRGVILRSLHPRISNGRELDREYN